MEAVPRVGLEAAHFACTSTVLPACTKVMLPVIVMSDALRNVMGISSW